MFAVPGWSVAPSAFKAQTLPAKPATVQNVAKNNNDAGDASKKRKRSVGANSQGREVNKNNLAQLWETVIEGKPKPKRTKVQRWKKEVVEEEQPVIEKMTEQKEGDLDSKDEGDAAPKKEFKQRVKKAKKMEEKKREKKGKDTAAPTVESSETPTQVPKAAPTPTPKPAPATKLTPLQASMHQKLISARFRHLNQTFYTTPSSHALNLVTENPELFIEYHEGFRRQVEVWPENPVNGYIASIEARGIIHPHERGKGKKTEEEDDVDQVTKSLPRTGGICNIADLGCGDAAISTALQPVTKKLGLRIHSFDLVSPSSLVTRADISNLPLSDNSIDIAIFCLALMGTNWIEFIEESYRILRWKGELWVAEIKSRFGRVGGKKEMVVEHSVGNRKRPFISESKEAKRVAKRSEEAFHDEVAAIEVDGNEVRGQETDVSAFVEVLRKRGFVLKGEGKPGNAGKEGIDLRNRMFVKMCFVKGATAIKGKCVPVPEGMEEFGGQTWRKKGKGKFLVEDGEDEGRGVQSEAGVLKPCVYKLR